MKRTGPIQFFQQVRTEVSRLHGQQGTKLW